MDYTEKQVLQGKAVLFLGAGASYNCTDHEKKRIGFTGNELLQKINETINIDPDSKKYNIN